MEFQLSSAHKWASVFCSTCLALSHHHVQPATTLCLLSSLSVLMVIIIYKAIALLESDKAGFENEKSFYFTPRKAKARYISWMFT